MHFTIVIPTRERPGTLEHTLRTCTAQDYDDLEILVSDNASADNTRDVVNAFDDRRIRYINTGRRLSMTGSFEFAFSNVKPGYMISIGDDDGIPMGAIRRAAEIVKETRTLAITTERAQYDWPGMPAGRENQIMFTTREGLGKRKLADYYPKVLNGRLSYYQIPLLYQCYVATELLDIVRARLGSMFHSQQLDIYSSMLLGGFLSNYVHSMAPLVINGASTKSNGAQHFGEVKDSSEILKWEAETDIPMRKPFRFAKSHRYLILEAFLQARDVLPELSAYTPNVERIFMTGLADVELAGNYADAEILRDVAQAMGYTLPEGRWPVVSRKLAAIINRYLSRATRLADTVVLDCSRYGVTDIGGAAKLMAEFPGGILRHDAGLTTQLRLALRRS